MSWQLYFTPQAQADLLSLDPELRQRAEQLLALLRQDPWATPPAYWRLLGDLHGAYSRRLDFEQRLIYQVFPNTHAVKICRVRTTAKVGASLPSAQPDATMPAPLYFKPTLVNDPLFLSINNAYLGDETQIVTQLVKEARLPGSDQQRIAERAHALVSEVRRQRVKGSGIDAFMHEYQLSSQEGVVLMCLAEALLRIPDAETRDKLIEDKISSANWDQHLWRSDSLFVNASTWGLMLTGRLIKLKDSQYTFRRLLQRSGEPLIRQAITQAMRIMGRQFVMGRTIREALERARAAEKHGYRHSYDMLGEAARTADDAERYFQAYQIAIEAIGQEAAGRGAIHSPGISVKLSALHPRYELAHGQRVMQELVPKLTALALQAKRYDIGLTVDAEEAERLDLSLEVLAAVFRNPQLQGWEGFGLALQAYQKRAFQVIDWLAALAREQGRRLMVRLVKGAYWDSEIKRAQERGLSGYPVFTRKANTDVSYLACARKLLALRDWFYPQFATHNAHTVSAILQMAGQRRDFEFQRLHGMGEALYQQIVSAEAVACRVYAPVGSHEDLLAYLVRRLLENGANTSFVNRIVDEKAPIEEIIADPVLKVAQLTNIPHPQIPLPAALYGAERRNAQGLDLSNLPGLEQLYSQIQQALTCSWSAAPMINGVEVSGIGRSVYAPADRRIAIGTVIDTTPEQLEQALAHAQQAQPAWNATPASQRAACLERMAELLEQHMPALIALCCREAGKTIADGIAEVREAVDFCRYYAERARQDFAEPLKLPGPTGERNQLSWHGRGVFVCISPWNFPLAIFLGQVSAALVAGNAVLAKPAEQTPLIAAYAVRLLHQAGVPPQVVQFLPGDGMSVGAPLVADARIAGVAFTGSTATAWAINQTLAAKRGPIVPLIAETGGLNAMLVDSSALPEQVVADVISSAFQSAGQRCSALRLLCVQEDIADKVIKMLKGAMQELNLGDPIYLSTDIGPVIDSDAQHMLQQHSESMVEQAYLIERLTLPTECAQGSFITPQAFELKQLEQLQQEIFGPILHIVRYRASELQKLIEKINKLGYGLTFGIHSRIDSTIRHVSERMQVGNIYVNRNMIGAVVGVQPFGGQGLSGTGFKAGGPNYLYRFAVERSLSINTTAAGGNASLMSLQESD